MKQKAKLMGMLALLAAAFIWGVSFPITDMGMEHVDAFTFKACSTMVAALGLLPLILLRAGKSKNGAEGGQKFTRKTLLYGSAIGVAHCVACSFQQLAFYHSTSGKIAFITAINNIKELIN